MDFCFLFQRKIQICEQAMQFCIKLLDTQSFFITKYNAHFIVILKNLVEGLLKCIFINTCCLVYFFKF